jgi:hypothetical protein
VKSPFGYIQGAIRIDHGRLTGTLKVKGVPEIEFHKREAIARMS